METINIRYCCIIILSLLTFTRLNAQNQTEIIINQATKQVSSTQETCNFNLTSINVSNQVKLSLSISDPQGKVFFKLTTIPFTLNQGAVFIDANYLRYQLQALVEVGSFDDSPPPGNYTLRIAVTDFNGRMLGSAEQNVTFTEEQKKKRGFLKPGLNGQMTSQLSTRQGTSSTLPPNFFRADLRPELKVWDIPLQANFFYTTEEQRQRQQMNQFNFQFNHSAFKQQLIQKVSEKIQLDKIKNLQNLSDFKNKTQELANIDKFLSEAQKPEFDKIDNIKSLEQFVSDSSLSELNTAKEKALEKTRKSVSASYDLRINFITKEINILAELPFTDSLTYKKKEARIDSLNIQLNETIASRDSAISKIKLPDGLNKNWWDAKNKLERLKNGNPLYQKYEAQKARYEKLLARKKQLEEWRSKIEQSKILSAIDNAENEFDVNTLNNPQQLKSKLKEYGMFKGQYKAMYSFRNIQVGTVFPSYSNLILDGVQLAGANVEINPGNFYLAACGGKSRRIAPAPGIPQSGFDQNMYFVKTGIGRPESSHFYLSALRIIDNQTSTFDTSLSKFPIANLIVGTDLKMSLFKGKFLIFGEGAVSQYIKNVNAPAIDLGEYNSLAENIPVFLPPNIATNIDAAYTIGGRFSLNKNNTVVEGFKRYIGPGYFSVGTPFLRNDLNRNELNLRQLFLKQKLEFTGFYREDVDNLLQFKYFLTRTTSIGSTLNLIHGKLPRIHLTFAPSRQVNPFGDFRMFLLGGGSNYSFKIKQIFNTLSINFNKGINTAPGDTSNYSSEALTFFYTVQLSQKISIGASYNSNRIEGNGNQISFKGYSGNLNIRPNRWYFQSFRASFFTGNSNTNYSISALSQFKINKFISWDVTITRNLFDDRLFTPNSFSEWMIFTGLQFNLN